MKKEIIIKDFINDNSKELEKIYLNSRIDTFTWLKGVEYKLNDFYDETKGEKIFVAYIDKKTVGFISIWEKDAFIHHLYIKKEYRGIGVGKKLIKVAKENLRSALKLKCLEKNVLALKFYKKNGWKIIYKGNSNEGYYFLLELKC